MLLALAPELFEIEMRRVSVDLSDGPDAGGLIEHEDTGQPVSIAMRVDAPRGTGAAGQRLSLAQSAPERRSAREWSLPSHRSACRQSPASHCRACSASVRDSRDQYAYWSAPPAWARSGQSSRASPAGSDGWDAAWAAAHR